MFKSNNQLTTYQYHVLSEQDLYQEGNLLSTVARLSDQPEKNKEKVVILLWCTKHNSTVI